MATRTINLDAISETARKGVIRTVVFLGLGVNAANDPHFNGYELNRFQGSRPTNVGYKFLPSKVTQKTLSEFKKEFGNWVVANGLRELVETFAVFLDQIQNACLTMALNRRKLTTKEAVAFAKQFPYKGIKEKLSLLNKRFNIRPEHPDYIISINQIRHCLTHRLGRVGPEDCKTDNKLTVRWLGLDFFAELVHI